MDGLANEGNLIPLNKRTKKEQRELQSQAGIKSGEVRRKKKTIKQIMKTLLDVCPVCARGTQCRRPGAAGQDRQC